MKKLILLITIASLSACKVIDDPVDTGICQSDKTKTMWEYFLSDTHGDWTIITEAIQYAGIKYIFDGSDSRYQQITFFGITDFSIKKFLYENQLQTIYDLTPEKCKTMLLSHIITEKRMKDSFGFEVKGTNDGGTILTTLSGKQLRIYRITTPGKYGPESGPVLMAIHALESGFKADIASANIEVKNGVVHALAYTYAWTEL